jgi:hypothetical protein
VCDAAVELRLIKKSPCVKRRLPYSLSVFVLLTRAYVSIPQHPSAYVSIRQHTSAHLVELRLIMYSRCVRAVSANGSSSASRIEAAVMRTKLKAANAGLSTSSIRQHTSAYVSIRQHTLAYVSIRGMYFCTSTASKVSTQVDAALQRLLRQHLSFCQYFCTSQESKVST